MELQRPSNLRNNRRSVRPKRYETSYWRLTIRSCSDKRPHPRRRPRRHRPFSHCCPVLRHYHGPAGFSAGVWHLHHITGGLSS